MRSTVAIDVLPSSRRTEGNGHMWPAFQNMTLCVARNNQRGTANSTILISWDVGMGLGILLGGINMNDGLIWYWLRTGQYSNAN